MTTSTSTVNVEVPVPPWRLTLLHTKFQILETIRIPIAMIGNLVFPALALLFFVVPQRAVADNPLFATAAVAQLSMFSIMSTALFTHGVGVAEDRALPFDTFVRALPAGAFPRLVGRILTGLWLSALSLIPLLLVGWLFTSATLRSAGSPPRSAWCSSWRSRSRSWGSRSGTGSPRRQRSPWSRWCCSRWPSRVGCSCRRDLPAWMNTISLALPSRAGRDMLVAVTTGAPMPASTIPVFAAWTLAFAVMAVMAYRNDEGRRYR